MILLHDQKIDENQWNYRHNFFVGIFLPMEIILCPLMSVYTDRKYLSAIRSVYTEGIRPSVYTDRITDGLYSFLESCNGVMT